MNIFDAVPKEWIIRSKFIQKFRNFNNCNFNLMIIYSTLNSFKKLLSITIEKGRGFKLNGMVGDVVEELEKYYNFRAIPIPDDGKVKQFEFYMMPMLQPDNLPFIVTSHLTPPLFFVPHTFLVTLGLAYTPMEKMILPFDDTTWYFFILSIAIASVVIFIVTKLSRETQSFVFGRDVRYPYFNISQIFFGMGMIRLPGRNFARFLMILFTLFCLVMRTAYQGKMFEQITGNVRRPTPKTVDELLNSDYPVVLKEIGPENKE